MCTFKDERNVLVCDVAIGHVRREVEALFGRAVRLAPIEGEGTLVTADATVSADEFATVTRAAIAAAQDVSRS